VVAQPCESRRDVCGRDDLDVPVIPLSPQKSSSGRIGALGVLSHDVGVTRLMGVAPMPVWMRYNRLNPPIPHRARTQ